MDRSQNFGSAAYENIVAYDRNLWMAGFSPYRYVRTNVAFTPYNGIFVYDDAYSSVTEFGSVAYCAAWWNCRVAKEIPQTIK